MTVKELQFFLNIFGNKKCNELKKALMEFKELQKRVPALRGDK